MAQIPTSPIYLFLIAVAVEIAGTVFLDLGATRNDSRYIIAAIALYATATVLFFHLVRAASSDFRTVLSLATVIILVAVVLIDTALISRTLPTTMQASGLLAAAAAVALLSLDFHA